MMLTIMIVVSIVVIQTFEFRFPASFHDSTCARSRSSRGHAASRLHPHLSLCAQNTLVSPNNTTHSQATHMPRPHLTSE